MRIAALALVSALALTACGQSGTTADGGASGGGGLFPDLTSGAYRAEATLSGENGETMPIVMIRDGNKVRMEIAAAEGASTIITNGETGESYVLTTQGGRTMAIRASGLDQAFENPADAWQGDLAETATRTGSCNVAGQGGAEWTKTSAEDGTDTVCVTDDGIILRATDDGRTVWETTRVDRGRQDASLFELPAGVQVMDLGNMGGMMEQMMEQARERQN
ncbi:MAG: hypothetical protein DCF16_07460 [Alphaproteobacteria bacterium]|nr:MAG: hypothetical protein DCF16_07460 [Alphaproteobacteria bacterium]